MAAINPRSTRRAQRVDDLIQERLSVRFERRLRREIARTMREAAAEYEKRGELGIALAISDHSAQMKRVLAEEYRAAAMFFGKQMLDAAKSARGPQVVKRETLEVFQGLLEDFIVEWTAARVTQINQTTESQIKDIIRSGIAEGLGVPKIAKQIIDIAPSISALRASVIARTETHSAANWGAQAAAEQTGVEFEKEWIAAEDERTREDHAEANGQRVPMREAFEVGGELLMFPGDPNGSAGNIINCRCAVAYWAE
jgi:SPP1 gp7 family putative phage head morphogenesis protein